MTKDFLNILREIRGSSKVGEIPTDGIWHELTSKDTDGNAGIHGDIVAKYNDIKDINSDAVGIKNAVEDISDDISSKASEINNAITTIDGLSAEIEFVDGADVAVTRDESVLKFVLPTPINGVDGTNGSNGIQGIKGDNGLDGLTPEYEFIYNNDTGDLECFLVGHKPVEQEEVEW